MNNAGVVARGSLEQIPLADWQWQFDVNVLGAVRGIRAFLPGMLERGSGHIINTASVAGLVALTGEGAPYIASKFAVVGLTEALALYARPRGVDVTLLCPGRVDTNLSETGRSVAMTTEREIAESAEATAIQGETIMQPREIAQLVVDAIEHKTFFVLADPTHQPLVARRAQNMNAFLNFRLRSISE